MQAALKQQFGDYFADPPAIAGRRGRVSPISPQKTGKNAPQPLAGHAANDSCSHAYVWWIVAEILWG
jgi:hypothetical protein